MLYKIADLVELEGTLRKFSQVLSFGSFEIRCIRVRQREPPKKNHLEKLGHVIMDQLRYTLSQKSRKTFSKNHFCFLTGFSRQLE